MRPRAPQRLWNALRVRIDAMPTVGAIFDLDGTLVDSADAHEHAWTALGVQLGLPVSRDFFLRFFGRPNPPIIRALFEEHGRTPPSDEEIARLADCKEAIYLDRIGAAFPPMPGGVALAHALAAAGWSLAIGSSAPPGNVRFMLDRLWPALDAPFNAVVTGACIERGKPHPDVFLEAAQRIGIAPERCIVIEDAAPGIEAAHRAGMRCAALCSKGHTPEELAAADLLVHRLDELSPSRLQSLLP